MGTGPTVAVAMGVITATFSGILRDLLGEGLVIGPWGLPNARTAPRATFSSLIPLNERAIFA